MLKISAFLLVALQLPAAEPLPITGISHIAFRVSDLEAARKFYTGLLGMPEAFQMKREDGTTGIAFLQVNDDQYIELAPGLPAGENVRVSHVSLITSDAPKLHAMLTARGQQPSEVKQGRDGNRAFRLTDTEGNILEFTEYLPGSWHSNARGKFAAAPRISRWLMHAGVLAEIENRERALAFYRDTLGFTEFWRGGPTDADVRWINLRMPGERGDYLELMLHDGAPTRGQLGSMLHACLEVDDIKKAQEELARRGLPDEPRYQPKIGRNNRWQLNVFDPDGSRTELMEPKPAN
jgi:catechol 2,3-dioxygenase-like lactoylglutathione lyase family enzyme